ncbi:acetyl-CoA acetyltransferase [Tardiphaga sp. 839_C3_N1_4]|jgi:acetyl-CoA acetyltransferase|uniref:acetyl-CoA acetyltransferase n=1 Tax=Tardiphaga sp. 839_C3_N1_4 TaxID=3240761 RepID=UPI003F22567F
MTASSLRGKSAIVGIGTYGLGRAPGLSSMDLMAGATARAVADAGLQLKDIDGICGGTLYHMFPTLSMGEYLGIRPKWACSDMTGGSSFLSHLLQATMAIEAGLCTTVLIAYGSNLKGAGTFGIHELPTFEKVYGLMSPLPGYAMCAARHMYEYGTTRAQMAEVAVAARQWAQLHPDATMKAPLTIDEVLASPLVADPLSRLDCCLMSDGGAAVIVTSPDRAKALKHKPVYFLGGAGASWSREVSQIPDFCTTPTAECAPRAFEMAGITTADVDVLQLYDAFTINVIMFLEDMRFCKKGEGGAFVSGGRIAPGGALPVNTNGGGLSFAHPGMYGLFTLIEATEQLRGNAGARQIADAEIAIAHGNGCTFSHEFTAVLGGANTL